MTQTAVPAHEAAILTRLIDPDQPTFSPAVAEAILAIDFNAANKERMRTLSALARDGALTVDAQAEMNGYERVGLLLNILQSKARRSLASLIPQIGWNVETPPCTCSPTGDWITT